MFYLRTHRAISALAQMQYIITALGPATTR